MMPHGAGRAQDILSAVRISDVWRELGGSRLRKSGASYRGRAWWRDGDGENVSLDDSRGVFHDFVSDQGGGILDLVVTVRGGTRADALRWLAERAGIALEDRPLTPAERASFARERAAVGRDEPGAQLWRRAAMSITEDLLHGLKVALFDPMAGPEPGIGEIMNLESLLARLRDLSGAALVEEYRWWKAREPEHVQGMVEAMAERDRQERRALFAFLQATSPDAEAA